MPFLNARRATYIPPIFNARFWAIPMAASMASWAMAITRPHWCT